jgi:hypothetical protein
MVCNGYVAGRITASRGVATFSNLEMQHSPKIFCIFLQKVLAKNTPFGLFDTPQSLYLWAFPRFFKLLKLANEFLSLYNFV